MAIKKENLYLVICGPFSFEILWKALHSKIHIHSEINYYSTIKIQS